MQRRARTALSKSDSVRELLVTLVVLAAAEAASVVGSERRLVGGDTDAPSVGSLTSAERKTSPM